MQELNAPLEPRRPKDRQTDHGASQGNLPALLQKAAAYGNGFVSIAAYKSKLGAAIIATQQPNLQENYQNYAQFR